MKKYSFILLIVAIAGGFAFWFMGGEKKTSLQSDYKSISFEIDGRSIELKNGLSEIEVAPGSASRLVTKFFGNEAEGDLNGDGISDKAFLLTQDSGGSGEFFYVAAALKNGDGYEGIGAAFLGDRIAPQTTEIRVKEVIVNFAVRKMGEPMSAQPTQGVTRNFKIEGNKLIEAKPNF